MQRIGLVLAICLSGLLTACPTSEPDDNPYDPNAPASVQADARVEGLVTLEGALSFADVSITATEAVADAPVSHSTLSQDTGAFALELPAGLYNIEITQQGYLTQFANNVEVRPGQTHKLGTFHLDIARGSLFGVVSLDDDESPIGTAVSAIPLDIPNGRTLTGLVGTDGSYFISGLAAGHYMIRAERQGYAPAYTSGLGAGRQTNSAIEVTVGSPATVPGLILYPAAAIVKVVDANTGVIKQYTNDLNVRVELYPFVEFLTQMEVSEDPNFAQPEPTWDTAFRDFVTPIDMTLSDSDGTHTIYARFRDSFGLVSDPFSTTVVVDRQPPTVPLFNINNGAPYLTTNDGTGTATLFFTGQDELSGIDAYRVTAAAGFSTEPYFPLESLGPSVSLSPQLALGDTNGLKTVLLVVRDRAGNVSPSNSASIIRDRIAPSVGVPALSIEPSELNGAGKVSQLQVTLLFDVTGDAPSEPLFMALANAQGLDGNSLFVPFESPTLHTLATGPDALAREVCAIFKDAAGLLTEQQCIDVGVDRTGTLNGVVHLEGQSTHSGVLVEVTHPTDPGTVYSDITDGTGAYQISGIPGGTGYTLRFFVSDFVEKFDYDVTVLTGTDTYRGITALELPRAAVSGVVTFVDKGDGQHGGIVISDAAGTYTTTTAPSGAFILAGLPATTGASYIISARYSNYVTTNFNQVDNLQDGENRALGTKILQKQLGDYRICANGPKTCPGGAIAYTQSRTVLLDVTSTDTFWRFGLDSSFTGQPFLAFDNSAIHLFTFAPAEPDGAKNIYVQFSSGGINPDGASMLGVVTLDTTAPVPAASNPLIIDANAGGVGAIYSNHPTGEVTLHLSASDAGSGVSGIRLARALPAQTPDFTGLPLLNYFVTVTTTLNTAVQGTQWLYVQFCDAVDNCTTVPSSPGDSIVYDTVAPNIGSGVSLTINSGNSITNSPFVTVNISTGDAVAVRFGNTASLAGADYIAVDPGQILDFGHILPNGEGTKTVYAQFKDAAGNESPISPNPNSDSITLDTLPPTGNSVSIAAAASYTTVSNVSLTLGSVDASEICIAGDIISPPDCLTNGWEAFGTTKAIDLSSGDGLKVVVVSFRDAATNSTQASDTIVVDTQPPYAPAISLNPSLYSKTGVVTATLGAADATQMCLWGDMVGGATDACISGSASWQTLQSSTSITLSSVDGLKTINVKYRDAAGLPSTQASASVTFDATAPSSGSVSINGGTSQTNTLNVSLSLVTSDATSGVEDMAIANESIDCSTATYEPFVSQRAWVLNNSDGLRTVLVCYKDRAGNTRQASSTITLDRQAPTSPSISFSSGLAYTTTTSAGLTLGATGATEMCIEGDLGSPPDCISNGWEIYATSKTVTLSTGDGTKAVTASFRDAAGNISQASATIILDTQAPSAASLVLSPSPYATTTALTATLAATGATQMCLYGDMVGGATDSCIAGSVSWQALLSTLPITLTSGDAVKTINVKYRDGAGWTSSTISEQVTLDGTPPVAGTVTLSGLDRSGASASLTRTPSVNVTLSGFSDATTGIAQMMVSESSVFSGATWQTYTTSFALALSAGDATKNVYVKVRDAVGNASSSAQGSIALDTTPPQAASVLVNGGAEYTNASDGSVTLTLAATGASWMRISTDGVFDSESWVAFAASTTATLSGSGLKTVYVIFEDNAGNQSPAVTDTITRDVTAPSGTFSINNGATFTNSVSVTLSLNATGADEMQIATDGTCDSEAYVAYATSAVALLPSGEGDKPICVRYRDHAQNTSSTSTQTITLDTLPPSSPVVATTAQVLNATGLPATTTISTSGPVTELHFDRYEIMSQPTDSVFSTASTNKNTTSFVVTVAEGTGLNGGSVANTIRLRAVDQAGNISPEASVIITEDSVNPPPPTISGNNDLYVSANTYALAMSFSSGSLTDPNFDFYEIRGNTSVGWSPTPSVNGLLYTLEQGDGVECSGTVPCPNVLRVRGVDKAGNTSTESNLTVYEDSTVPTAPRLGPADTFVRADQVTIRLFDNSEDNGGDVFIYQVFGGQYSEYQDTAARDFFVFDVTPNLDNRYCVRGRDQAGNVGIEGCTTITERTIRGITQTGTDEREIDLAGDYIVYTHLDNQGAATAKLHNLIDGSTSDLEASSVALNTRNARIALMPNGYVIVFQNDYGGQKAQLKQIFYDGTNLSSNFSGYGPDTDGVDWVFNAPGNCSSGLTLGGICRPRVDGSRGMATGAFVAADRAWQSNPRVFNNRVVWTRCIDQLGGNNCCQGGGCPPNTSPVSYVLARATCNNINCPTVEDVVALTAPTQPVIGNQYIAWVDLPSASADTGTLYYMPKGGNAASVIATGLTGVKRDIDIEGNRILYSQHAGITEDIYMYSIGEPTPIRQLTSTLLGDSSPALSGARVAWSQHTVGASDISLIELNETKWAHVANILRVNVEVLDDHLVWIDADALGTNSPGLKAYRVSSGDEFLPAGTDNFLDFAGDDGPALLHRGGGSYLAWVASTNPGAVVRIRNMTTTNPASPGAPITITTSGVGAAGGVNLATDGSEVTWLQTNGANEEIYVSSLPPPISPTLVFSDTTSKRNLEIAGDVIVWEKSPASFDENGEIRCYNRLSSTGGLAVAAGSRPRLAGQAGGPYYLVWQVMPSAPANRQRDVKGCVLTCSTTPTCSPITLDDGTYDQFYIDVDQDGRTAWITNNRPGGYRGVVMGSIAAPHTRVSLTVGIDGEATRDQPVFYGDTVYWIDSRFGAPDLYQYTIVY